MATAKAMAKLLTYDEALAIVLTRVTPLHPQSVRLEDATGRVLREDIRTDRDLPPFDRATMDGFAVHSKKVRPGVQFQITASLRAGQSPRLPRTDGVMRIATGAVIPEGYDAVIPVEQAEISTNKNESVRFCTGRVEPGLNIHRRGADASNGHIIVPTGVRLRSPQIGLAASVGRHQLRISPEPRVTVLSTGDELQPLETPTHQLQPHQIRNSNGPMIAAFVQSLAGASPIQLHQDHAPDNPSSTRLAAERALSRSDLVLTTGGVGVSAHDLLASTWGQLGLVSVLHGVRIQPGKPLLVCQEHGGHVLVLGLPGNPVSALVTAHLFLWPVWRKMLGLNPKLPWRLIRLAGPAQPCVNREVFRAVKLVGPNRDRAAVIPWQGSGDLTHTVTSDGWIRLPQQARIIQPDATVPFLPLR